MSADTSFVVAKRGGNFYAAIIQAAEDLLDPHRAIRWEKAVHCFLRGSQRLSCFSSLEGALGHMVDLRGRDNVFIEYDEPVLIEILYDNKDVRRLKV